MWSTESRQPTLSLTQEFEYFPLNLELPEDKKIIDKILFFKGNQQNGNYGKQKTETQEEFSWKENMKEKAAGRRAGREPDPLTTSSMNAKRTGLHILKITISDILY